MNYIKSILVLSLLPFFVIGCNDDVTRTIAPNTNPTTDGTENVVINIEKTYQTIESFAASDAWTPNIVGSKWNNDVKENIARLLFSQTITEGKVEGIGLSGWRFNLGGGSAEQGEASGIEDASRRSESFLNADGTYNWTKQAGQQYFLDKAKSYGCEQFVMFSNTPPVSMTKNGKGFSGGGVYSNLKENAYDKFASYIATVIEYFKNNKGINFSLISPVNEPQYDWTSGQEGSPWQNNEIQKLSIELDKALENKNLDTQILLSEAGAWNYLYETDGDAGRKNVINELFNSASSNNVSNLKHVAPIIAGHSYWTDAVWDNMVSVRSKLWNVAQAAGLKVYQTEWSMLGDGYDKSPEFVGFENASYMDIALYMSKVIHADLVYANVSSWSFWTSMDVSRWNHKNRFLLINLTPAGGAYSDVAQSGTADATKSLWVLGNYSLFIRPNYKRVDLAMNGTSKEVFGSAYISPDKKTVVAVYSNLSKKAYEVKSKFEQGEVASIKTYTTNELQNLSESKVDINNSISVNPNSVVTVVYSMK